MDFTELIGYLLPTFLIGAAAGFYLARIIF